MHRLRLFAGLAILTLTASLALAQTGSIQGTVTDSVGAVVQGAEIMVRNVGSNAVRTVASSGTGAYSVPTLPVGAYEITVKMASFKTYHASDVQLSVAQALSLNIQLEPGSVTEEVQVSADQIPAVDLETSQVSNLVDERAIKDLPLITRNPYELVLLSPGTSPASTSCPIHQTRYLPQLFRMAHCWRQCCLTPISVTPPATIGTSVSNVNSPGTTLSIWLT